MWHVHFVQRPPLDSYCNIAQQDLNLFFFVFSSPPPPIFPTPWGFQLNILNGPGWYRLLNFNKINPITSKCNCGELSHIARCNFSYQPLPTKHHVPKFWHFAQSFQNIANYHVEMIENQSNSSSIADFILQIYRVPLLPLLIQRATG